MAIVKNPSGSRKTLIYSKATETITLADLATSNAEVITGFTITKITWSGNVAIARDANTLFTFNAGSAGQLLFDVYGMNFDNDIASANLTITIGTGGSSIVEVHKKSSLPNF